MHLVDADRTPDRLGGAPVVAGSHDDPQPAGAQRGDGARRRLLHPVGDRDEAGGRPVDGDEQDGLPGCRQRLRDLLQRRGIDPGVPQHRGVAERDLASADPAADPLARDRGKVIGIGGEALDTAVGGACHDGVGKRMLRPPLQRGGQRQDPVGLETRGGDHVGQRRSAGGQGPGLVDDQHVHLREPFQGFRVAHEHPGTGAPAGRHHDRHRRGQTERARAGDDEDADRRGSRKGQRRRRSEQQPRGARDRGDGDDHGHQPAGDPIRQRLDRRAAALGARDQVDDAGEQGVSTDPLGAHHEGAGPVERAAGHRVVGRLLHRHRLAREHALVHGAVTGEHHAVDRNALAGPDAEPLARPDLLQGHVLLPVVVHAPGPGRGQVEQ